MHKNDNTKIFVDKININGSRTLQNRWTVNTYKLTFDTQGGTSLDAVELIMALEDEFGMEIEDDAAQSIKSVGDLVNYIESHK